MCLDYITTKDKNVITKTLSSLKKVKKFGKTWYVGWKSNPKRKNMVRLFGNSYPINQELLSYNNINVKTCFNSSNTYNAGFHVLTSRQAARNYENGTVFKVLFRDVTCVGIQYDEEVCIANEIIMLWDKK